MKRWAPRRCSPSVAGSCQISHRAGIAAIGPAGQHYRCPDRRSILKVRWSWVVITDELLQVLFSSHLAWQMPQCRWSRSKSWRSPTTRQSPSSFGCIWKRIDASYRRTQFWCPSCWSRGGRERSGSSWPLLLRLVAVVVFCWRNVKHTLILVTI